ncbi:MAG: uroporphyrinogen decarboxylase family protein [Kiritimatiellae bacterium]|nr:uroporphyrinogen decarboxylase family protein [Kiritimatiellia bacterium]
MTNRERFLRTMHYEVVDRPPFIQASPWPDTWKRWYREGYPRGVEPGEFFGMDVFRWHDVNIDTFLIPPIEAAILEDHKDYVIRRDCFGATVKDFKEHTSMPQWLDYGVKTPADLDALLERLEWNDGKGRIPADWDAQVRTIKTSGLGCRVQIGSYYGNLRNLMGVERLSVMLYDAPEAIQRFNDRYHAVIMRTMEVAFQDLKGEVICGSASEDFAYKTAPLLSPAMYRKFVMPYQREATDYCKSHGVDLFWFDSDGNIRSLLPDLLEAGINIFYPMECAAGMDPVTIRQEFCRAARMIGGIDKREIARGKEAIRREMRRKIPTLIEEGGYIPMIDHSVGSDISLANYRCYVDTLKELYNERIGHGT